MPAKFAGTNIFGIFREDMGAVTDAMQADLVFDGVQTTDLTVLLAHGAGAPMDSPFMQSMTDGLVACGLSVVRFEFPYMALRRRDGKRRGPDKIGRLLDSYRDVVEELGAKRLIVGGKSMGGRVASMIADEMGVRGLVCLGYPFHPPGKPEKTRTAHLEDLVTPALILQGERDTFGTPSDVEGYRLSSAIEVRWLADGDHSFKPRKKSGITEDDNLRAAQRAIAAFAAKV